ncbi:MAG: hypothetical protein FWD17_04850 [Polyangiaceae bacterium]|nr:hypothetical protein [Polyangiaceae bacterium]
MPFTQASSWGAIALALAGSACAGQSDAFHRVSPMDHERIAQSDRGPTTDATPEATMLAAQRLRADEASACAEVPVEDRDLGPLASRSRIAGVEDLSEHVHPKELAQPVGAAIVVRATPGLTAEWLGRLISCHMAHHAVVGNGIADAASPLFVSDARIAVSSTGDGFRISITANDVDAARQIIERAHAMFQ